MAAVIPNSTIQFFGDVGLSPSYDDTRYFATEAAKDAFFDGLQKDSVPACTFVRGTTNKVRVQLPMSICAYKQYMRYRNTGFIGKWFYAFIIAVEYINNVTTEITFQPDPMMTWMGSFTLSPCFVERQHAAADAIGQNLTEENLDIGDYVYNEIGRTGELSNTYQILLGASVNQQGQAVVGGEMINGVYSGIQIHQFGTAEAANAFINLLTDKAKSDAIVGAVMCPSGFAPETGGTTPSPKLVSFPKRYSNLNGYVPRNKKLYTYPYNFLSVTNGDGNFATFRYEFFGTGQTEPDNCDFFLYGQPDLQPEFILEPIKYKTNQTDIYNSAEKLTLKGFPQCAFNVDQYKAFLAQNSSSIAADAISTVGSGAISTIINAMTGNVLGAVSSGLNAGAQIMNTVAMHMDYAKKPPQSNGVTTGSIEAGRKLKDFYFLAQSITYEYARKIDQFFDMFGYAQNALMQPNMHVRPSWTYVKTIGAIVHCNAPAEDVRKIESLFDAGIRFWDAAVTVGDYSAANGV